MWGHRITCTSMDTRSTSWLTPDQQLVSSQPSVDWLIQSCTCICINQKLLDSQPSVDCASIECQPRCWWRFVPEYWIDQHSIQFFICLFARNTVHDRLLPMTSPKLGHCYQSLTFWLRFQNGRNCWWTWWIFIRQRESSLSWAVVKAHPIMISVNYQQKKTLSFLLL